MLLEASLQITRLSDIERSISTAQYVDPVRHQTTMASSLDRINAVRRLLGIAEARRSGHHERAVASEVSLRLGPGHSGALLRAPFASLPLVASRMVEAAGVEP